MRKLHLIGVIAASLTLAPIPSIAQPAGTDDAAYRHLADDYLTGFLAWRPEAGTGLGLHEYDGKVTDLSRASIEREQERMTRARASLTAIDQGKLSPEMSRECRALLASINAELLGFEVFHGHYRNPMTYSAAFDLTTYAKRDFAPKPQRLRSVVAILREVPRTIADGRANLEDRLARPYITTAIEEANGTADFISDDLVKAFDDVKDDELQADFARARAAAAAEMKGYAKWLESEKLPKAGDEFAMGPGAYAHMLRDTELLALSPEQVLEIGLRELKREQERFAAAAARIDRAKPALEVFKSIQHEHPTEQSLIPDTVRHLDAIRQFVIDRKLVSFPSMVPVKVEETPKFARATSFASMDSPGPFENASEAFYYVTPTEPTWDAKRKEEWLTSFSFYATDVTSIHEAYPGHYVQHLHLKASNASKIDKVFGSYAFIEGWAHYCEQMVIDEGYPAGVEDATAAKYRLDQSQEALLRLCRLCVSMKMHCQKMTVEEATKFFMDNCYYEEAPARQEAIRGTFDPGYCFYTLGKLQILKLREDYKRQEGAGFSLMKFHDEMLGHGQPPIRLLREAILKDKALWDAAL
jgi:uncharacterized protein (DUF885 family)